jgi:hypothetical protein
MGHEASYWRVYALVADGEHDQNTPISSYFLSAPGVIRTRDLSLRRRALYPLSYGRRWTAD